MDAELEFDPGRVAGFAIVAAELGLRAVVAGGTAVQREANGVEQAGLACSGLAGDEEDTVVVEAFEVDLLFVFVWAETRKSQPLDLHASTFTSTGSTAAWSGRGSSGSS